MAQIKRFKMTKSERIRRRFSENFKNSKVREIERGCYTKVSEICKQYEVSAVSVYRWLDKHSTMKGKKERLIVESMSDTRELLVSSQH